ncbi:hypothetical protein CVT26_015235 [Gymnopilus dilepis]|uniref:Ribonuclease H1 N-terminal domain-containing protein n=1 Tax=Gymnopilus dilepis TaxID=231916 RepID=A0A409W430_9AGAR|nr:hypothetical protein CVT26_015235 [Gymnopilus dilepis]
MTGPTGGILGGTLRALPDDLTIQTGSRTTARLLPTHLEIQTVVHNNELDNELNNELDNDAIEDGYNSDNGDGLESLVSGMSSNNGLQVPDTPPPLYTPTGIPMKKKYRPTPPGELMQFSGPCFIMMRAQETGVFPFNDRYLSRVAGMGRRAVWEYRRDADEARRLYTALYNAGLVSAEPFPNSPFANNAFDWVPDVNPPVVHRAPIQGFLPPPETLRPTQSMYKFYLVKKGEEVGIFGSWCEAAARINSLKGIGKAEWKRYSSWSRAYRMYRRAFYLDELSATPVVGGHFDVHA